MSIRESLKKETANYITSYKLSLGPVAWPAVWLVRAGRNTVGLNNSNDSSVALNVPVTVNPHAIADLLLVECSNHQCTCECPALTTSPLVQTLTGLVHFFFKILTWPVFTSSGHQSIFQYSFVLSLHLLNAICSLLHAVEKRSTLVLCGATGVHCSPVRNDTCSFLSGIKRRSNSNIQHMSRSS